MLHPIAHLMNKLRSYILLILKYIKLQMRYVFKIKQIEGNNDKTFDASSEAENLVKN